MKLLRRILILLSVVPLLLSCADEDDYLEKLLSSTKKPDKGSLQVTGLTFDKACKHFTVDTRVLKSIGGHSLSDSCDVTIVAREYDYLDRPLFSASQPVLTKVTSTGASQVVSLNLKMLVLVDLTLSQEDVDRERDAVREMSTLFTADNLFVSFITGDHRVSGVMAPSEYVLAKYFKSTQSGTKSLYSSILSALELITDESGAFSDVSKRIVMVLSDGKVFNEEPFGVEDNYFSLKSELLAKSLRTKSSHMMFYVDMTNDSAEGVNDAEIFLRSVCANTGGASYEGFDWVKMEDDIFSRLHIKYSDYRFEFTNPDRKMYSGSRNTLKIDCYHGETLIASGSTEIRLGTYFRPVVVNATPRPVLVARGLIFALTFLILIYLVLQIAVPAVRYRVFKRKYVVDYAHNMSVDDVMLGDICYYCKAPFSEGEKVVAKCKHTMHLSCWQENEYHCPEHGRNCREGSHYYNSANLLDPRNAPFYSKWIVAAIIAAIIGWVTYMLAESSFNYDRLSDMSGGSEGLVQGGFILPVFGLIMSAILGMCLCTITVRKRDIRVRVLEALARSLVAGAVSFLAFMLTALAYVSVTLEGSSALLDWMPWTLSAVSVAFCCTWRTNYQIRPKSLLLVAAVGVASMLVWTFMSVKLSLDYRPYLLLTFCIFTVGVALGVAQSAPRSEKYFLHLSGAVKEMDIALYKWFSSDSDAVVSIGKSVDCSLEMSWDIAPGIGPRQAEIKRLGDALYLFAVDNGVKLGRHTLRDGDKVRLYHGRSFRIGNTEFLFQERDI